MQRIEKSGKPLPKGKYVLGSSQKLESNANSPRKSMNFKASSIGSVPAHWVVGELKNFLTRITYGFTNPMSDAADGPWKITAKDVVDGYINYATARKTTQLEFDEKLTDKSRPKVGDVLLTKDGSIGRVAVVDRPGICINQSVALLQPNQSIDPFFLKYLLLTPHYQTVMANDADGSTIKHIYITRVDKMEVAVPPRNEQEQILGVIKTIDDKIQLNHQINQTLEQIAQALFKSWFVDFEPVKAKIAAKARWLASQPSAESASPVCYADELEPQAGAVDLETYMNLAAMQAISGKTRPQLAQLEAEQPEQYTELQATAALFPAAMQESELGEIPEGWETKQIGDVVERLGVGKKYSQKTVSAIGQVPVLDQGKSGVIGYHDGRPGVHASPADPVIAFANHTCYMRLIMHDFSAIQNVLPFKGKSTNIYWLYFATLGKQAFIEYKGHWPDFVVKEIVVPAGRLSDRFGEAVAQKMEDIFCNDRQSQLLSDLRDTLLPKLLSGELTLPEAEQQTREASGV